jgi:hypothetical protein
VTGERHLFGRRPDAVAVIGAVDGRRLHERRLHELRLAREGAHHLVAHVLRVVHHRQPVAGQRRGREHIEQRVRVRAQNSATPSSGVLAWA